MFPQLDLNPDVVCSRLDDGGVLFDLTTKQYFALNRSGLLAWQYLEDGGTIQALAAALGARGHAAEPELAAFAQALLAHELATTSTGPSDAGEPAAPVLPDTWSAPTLTPHGRPLAEVILSPFDPTVPVPE